MRPGGSPGRGGEERAGAGSTTQPPPLIPRPRTPSSAVRCLLFLFPFPAAAGSRLQPGRAAPPRAPESRMGRRGPRAPLPVLMLVSLRSSNGGHGWDRAAPPGDSAPLAPPALPRDPLPVPRVTGPAAGRGCSATDEEAGATASACSVGPKPGCPTRTHTPPHAYVHTCADPHALLPSQPGTRSHVSTHMCHACRLLCVHDPMCSVPCQWCPTCRTFTQCHTCAHMASCMQNVTHAPMLSHVQNVTREPMLSCMQNVTCAHTLSRVQAAMCAPARALPHLSTRLCVPSRLHMPAHQLRCAHSPTVTHRLSHECPSHAHTWSCIHTSLRASLVHTPRQDGTRRGRERRREEASSTASVLLPPG